jgi:uncharacterized membrane protein
MTNASSPETVVELSRLNNLSDSVFGFALTLLVLDIRVPDNTPAQGLTGQIIALAPKLLIYLISFVVIGGAWGSHQRMLSQIRRGDGLLVWFNLFLLLFVTFLPACAALLGRYPGELVAVLCFAADVILIQLTEMRLWRHASKNGLINPMIDPRVVSGVGRRISLAAIAFAASLILAVIYIPAVYIVWIGLFTALFLTDWLSWEQTLKSIQSVVALDGAARGQLAVVHSAGHLTMVTDAKENMLAQGTFGGGLDSHIAHTGDLLDAHLVVPKKLGLMSYRYPWAWGPASTLDWNLSVNPHVPLKLNIETAGDQVDLLLTEAQITELGLKTSGSSVDLRLPANAGQTSVHIHANGASLTIQVPPDVAARVRADNSISNVEVDPKRFSLVEDGKAYTCGDYDMAVNRVEILLAQAFSFVKIV